MRKDRPRVIGTLNERIALYQAAGTVLSSMEACQLFSKTDIDSLQTVIQVFSGSPNQGYGAFVPILRITERPGMRVNEPGES